MSPARLRRFFGTAAAAAGLLGVAAEVHAEEVAPSALSPGTAVGDSRPDPALGIATGTLTLVLGMGTGASIIASDAGRTSDIAGWMVMQSSFAIAPLAAHGVVGEWGRGLWYATPPLATTAGTATVFAVDSNAVRHSNLTEQRILWPLFVVGLFSSAYGIIDTAFADSRARRVVATPVVGTGFTGIDIRGTL
jgi:hypothetical protein